MALNVRLGWGLEIFLLIEVNESQVAALLLSKWPLHGMFAETCGLCFLPQDRRLRILCLLVLDRDFDQTPGQFPGLDRTDTDSDLVGSEHPAAFGAVLRDSQKHINVVAGVRRTQEYSDVPASVRQIDFHFGNHQFGPALPFLQD